LQNKDKISFDDDGKPIGTTDFDFAAVDHALELDAIETDYQKTVDYQKEKLRDFMRIFFESIVTNSAGVNEAGCNVWILAYLLKQTPFRTQAELAEKMKITQGRVSQLISDFTRKNPMLKGVL
jgi:DNA-directed RNA polymerase specialized sigma subunit